MILSSKCSLSFIVAAVCATAPVHLDLGRQNSIAHLSQRIERLLLRRLSGSSVCLPTCWLWQAHCARCRALRHCIRPLCCAACPLRDWVSAAGVGCGKSLRRGRRLWPLMLSRIRCLLRAHMLQSKCIISRTKKLVTKYEVGV